MKQVEILDAVKTTLETEFSTIPVYIASQGDRPVTTAIPFMVISDGAENQPEFSTGPGEKTQFNFSVFIAVQSDNEYAAIADTDGILDYAAQVITALHSSDLGVENSTVDSLWIMYSGSGPSVPTLMGDTATEIKQGLPLLVEKQINFIAEYFE